MALVEAASMTFSAAMEVASLMWMELSMFAVAALIYFFAIGGSSCPFHGVEASFKEEDRGS